MLGSTLAGSPPDPRWETSAKCHSDGQHAGVPSRQHQPSSPAPQSATQQWRRRSGDADGSLAQGQQPVSQQQASTVQCAPQAAEPRYCYPDSGQSLARRHQPSTAISCQALQTASLALATTCSRNKWWSSRRGTQDWFENVRSAARHPASSLALFWYVDCLVQAFSCCLSRRTAQKPKAGTAESLSDALNMPPPRCSRRSGPNLLVGYSVATTRIAARPVCTCSAGRCIRSHMAATLIPSLNTLVCRSQPPHAPSSKGSDSVASSHRSLKRRLRHSRARKLLPARVRHAWRKYHAWLQAVIYGVVRASFLAVSSRC